MDRSFSVFHSTNSSSGRLLALVGFLLVVGSAVGTGTRAEAQSPVDLETATQYANDLEQNFWERAWVESLASRADREGSINWNYDDRRSLSELTADYRSGLQQRGAFWTDLQVEDYLRRQLLAVQPNPMMPGRPGSFQVRILSTPVPNALAFNDGTIYVTTGLLATLHAAEELRAVLAHEVAHVVLDHALSAYRSGKKRSRARKILNDIVGGAVSVITPGFGRSGSLESTAYSLSTDLATEYLSREFIGAAGLQYSRDQEQAANRLAQEWLLAEGEPPAALHTALRRLYRTGTQAPPSRGAFFLDSHPPGDDWQSELAALIREHGGDPDVLTGAAPSPNSTYDTHIAAVLEHQAEMELTAQRFHRALGALDRALQADWATPEASLYKAIAVRNTTTGQAGTAEALRLLREAEAMARGLDPRIEAERALLHLRERRYVEARRSLTRCLEAIDPPPMDSTEVETSQEGTPEGYHTLRAWATKMSRRLAE